MTRGSTLDLFTYSCTRCKKNASTIQACLECSSYECQDCSNHQDHHDHHVVEIKDRTRADLPEIKRELKALFLGLSHQNEVSTYFEKTLRRWIGDWIRKDRATLDDLTSEEIILMEFLHRRRSGRFADYFERSAKFRMDIPEMALTFSQGVGRRLKWNNQDLFKSSYDLAIYQQLLAEHRPKTVFEIGSGTGASAMWFADMGRALEIDLRVMSLDISPPELKYQRVDFLQGDCQDLEKDPALKDLPSLPRPWLVIEDAHVNVLGILTHFDQHLRPGDYLVVEDNVGKDFDLGLFLQSRRKRFLVDTAYTDLFGENATSAKNSIFKCFE